MKRHLFIWIASWMVMGTLAHADASVWDQMQNGETSHAKAKITSLEVSGGSVTVGYTLVGAGSNASQTARFCDDFSTEDHANGYFDSESRRAALSMERMEMLRDAYKSGDTVELSSSGPWNPCLQSVRLVKTAAAHRTKSRGG